MTESKGVLTYYNERNKAFDKLPGVAGMGYYVIGDEPGFIDLYMINQDSDTREDDEGIEFGFKSLKDAAKYVNVVTGRNGYQIGKFKNTLNLKDHDDIHFIQLNATAMEHLKKLIEEPTVEILPYSTDDFVLKGSDAVVSKLQKKYKLLSSPSSDGRLDRHDLVKYKDDDSSQGLEGKLLSNETQYGVPTVGHSYKDLMKLGHAARRDNYQYKYNNQDYWENDMNIYEQLNKINDTESLSEKYNVKNVKELKKLRESQTKRAKKIKLNESLSDIQEEAIDITKDYILDNYSWSDWDSNVEGSTLTFTIWFDDDWGGEDSSETIFTLDINKLVEYMNDEEALGNYIESGEDYTNYEARGQEFYERAEKELEKHFGCTNAYLEPSTQMGRGGTFLFADDMSFEGNFDYQTGEQYIQEDNFDGFLQLCLDSFTPRTDESLKESSNGKQDVRHEAQRIHDELIKKGYTNEEIDSIIRILHTSSINNFEPARPKLKAAFPDLDI